MRGIGRRVGRSCTLFAVAAALGLTTAGCAEEGPNYPTGADQPVLRLTELRGYLRPGEPASVVPTFTMYGDGRVIVRTPTDDEGALPELRQLRLPRERVQQLVDHAIDADVLNGREAGTEIGPDAPISLITLNAEDRTGTAELGPNVRGDLGKLRETMYAYAENPEAKPYDSGALAVLATPWEGDPDRTWPLGALGADSTRLDGSYCVVYRNADARTARQQAREAEADDVWYSGEATYVLSFRPLLPDETDCTSLSTRERES